MRMTQLPSLIKIGSTLILGGLLAIFSPTIVNRMVVQQSIPERVKGVETQVDSVEHRMDKLEAQQIRQDEMLSVLRTEESSVKATQNGVISIVIPTFLFMCTASWQEWLRIRGNHKTRSTDGEKIK
jgi:hypothetical protein